MWARYPCKQTWFQWYGCRGPPRVEPGVDGGGGGVRGGERGEREERERGREREREGGAPTAQIVGAEVG